MSLTDAIYMCAKRTGPSDSGEKIT
jgi:hypothetical protein